MEPRYVKRIVENLENSGKENQENVENVRGMHVRKFLKDSGEKFDL